MPEGRNEFQLIRQIQRSTLVASPGVKLGIGDDAAVLDVPVGQHLVAATDTLNAGVHFPADTLPFDIGYKCLAVNLSDLAAMGAVPHRVLLSLSLPEADPDWVQSFTAGFMSLAEPFGVALVGGDTTSGPLSVSLTALGTVEPGRQLQRNGACAGDLLVVSGTVGGAARVLDLLQAAIDPGACSQPDRSLLDRPHPRVKLGQALTGYASACIDISDGLLADLGHLVTASGCAARLAIDTLPAASLLADLKAEQKLAYQLAGGDDYELLFTLPEQYASQINGWSGELGVDLTIIGNIEDGDGIHCMRADGTEYHARATGFDHFAAKPQGNT